MNRFLLQKWSKKEPIILKKTKNGGVAKVVGIYYLVAIVGVLITLRFLI